MMRRLKYAAKMLASCTVQQEVHVACGKEHPRAQHPLIFVMALQSTKNEAKCTGNNWMALLGGVIETNKQQRRLPAKPIVGGNNKTKRLCPHHWLLEMLHRFKPLDLSCIIFFGYSVASKEWPDKNQTKEVEKPQALKRYSSGFTSLQD